MWKDEARQYFLKHGRPRKRDDKLWREIWERDRVCQVCAADQNLTLMHWIHTGMGGSEVFNDPRCVLMGCHTCHARYDGQRRGRIDIPYFDPNDREDGIVVLMETGSGGWINIPKERLGFYNPEGQTC